MPEPGDAADITERLRHHIDWLAASGYPASLHRDALAEILRLRQELEAARQSRHDQPPAQAGQSEPASSRSA